MYKNRFILVLGLLSMLFVGMAVTQSRSLSLLPLDKLRAIWHEDTICPAADSEIP